VNLDSITAKTYNDWQPRNAYLCITQSLRYISMRFSH